MYLLKKLQATKWEYIALFMILVIGVFLRTYHFHDWLRFSPDQARDTNIISNAIEGKASLPLLGPIAGGTNFHLGPIFYYFGYAAALFFGNSPDKMAYPELVFSVLSIPLLFFFLKKYFTLEISLALTALMSVSYSFISIARFASNPNSIPFFTLLFLYAVLEWMGEKNRKNCFWPILAGLSLGVGVQLHTFLLLIMPVVLLVVLFFLAMRKNLSWKSVFLMLVFAFLVNAPQISHEISTDGGNIREFFVSSNVQSEGRKNVLENTSLVVSCHIQTNANMIFSLENMEECGDLFSAENAVKKYRDTPGVISSISLFKLAALFSVLFSLSGYFLFGYYYRRESDMARKNFLRLLVLYNAVALLFFIPVASHMEPRYYVIVFFTPFVLFGVCLQFLIEKFPRTGRVGFAAIIVLCMVLNAVVVWKSFVPYLEQRASDTENSVLGEMEPIIEYMADHSESKTVYLVGGKIYLKRFSGPLAYLGRKSGIEVVEFDDATATGQETALFHIAPASSMKQKTGEELWEHSIVDQRQFGKVMISVLQ